MSRPEADQRPTTLREIAGLFLTIGIFLPSFLFVALTNPPIPRRSPWMGAFPDGVNVATVGLMVAVTWELCRAAFVAWLTATLALAAALLLMRFKVNRPG